MTEHCYRMTIQPEDVAKAMELFAADHEDADDDWAEEEVEDAGEKVEEEIEKMSQNEESEADEENDSFCNPDFVAFGIISII